MWDSFVFIAINTDWIKLQLEDRLMGNRNPNIRATNRLEPIQNNKKIIDVKNNNIKIFNVIRFTNNKRFLKQCFIKITIEKNINKINVRAWIYKKI